VADRIFERMPHIEDEIAYVWQAQAIAHGRLTLPSPEYPKSFLVPFVVDYKGQRFGKYPLGWPALLAVGEFFGGRAWVNALLAGLGVWLTYRLGQRLFSETVGLLAAGLTVTSPFFLMNSGSLLSHPFGLVLSAAFALAWLDAWEDNAPRRWLPLTTAALCLGLLTLTRPLTAVGLAIPFLPHAAWLWFKRDWTLRRRLILFALIVLVLALLIPVWQMAVTGDPLLNPYTLWWSYDKLGFGPGVGRLPGGHTLTQARINTKFSLWVGWYDYFGWGYYSWLFLPAGALALLRLRRWKALPALAVFPTLVVVYLAYWIGSSLYGPRYFYEGLYGLTLGSALGIAFLAGWPIQPDEPGREGTGWLRRRRLAMTAVLALLLSTNLIFYTPARLQSMHGLYGINRLRLEPFIVAQAQGLTPALVIVHPQIWTEYGSLLELTDPFLDTPFLLVISTDPVTDAAVAGAYSGQRKVYYYYPDTPWEFYKTARPGP
jgi:4-amino-4-deoxy-L-arabinose transferase-like glycosyltransferase